MKIGVRAHDFGKKEADVLFKEIMDIGYTGIQLAFRKAIKGIDGPDDLDKAFIEGIRKTVLKSEMEIPVLGCYIEPSYTNEEKRRAEVIAFIRQMSFAKAINAGCIGTETTNMEKLKDTRENGMLSLKASLEEIMLHAEDLGVDVAIEPVHYHVMNTPERTKEILDAIPSRRLKVIFDPVNLLSLEEIENQHELWDRSFECFGERIAAVHLKGIRCDENGNLVSSSFKDSIIDYAYIVKKLQGYILEGLISKDIYLLREEVKPACAREDYEFMKELVNKVE
ncbi:MAG: TIM barrel protein [Clostridiaceae bacterium]